MKPQQQLILSIGSNQGNRLGNIQKSILEIHQQIGTVITVSKLYETPAWGFSSDAFYNCVVLVHTQLMPEVVLQKAKAIEVAMGRMPNTSNQYQARIIDIDLILVENEIIDLENLKIPHPRMQDRRFVLRPLLDLGLEWQHPILKKSITSLANECLDDSYCTFIQKLKSPLDAIGLHQLNYIAFEGNIGVGKSTLTNQIAQDFNAKTVLERFSDNPFLAKFYEDKKRYAFSLEMSFLADRYQQISSDLAQFDLFSSFVVSDYYIFKSLIFAKITLSDAEYNLYKTFFDVMYQSMPKPDLYVYLYQKTERLLKNIKKRGRAYEQSIEAEYLERINASYLEYVKTQTALNVLLIDVSELDFVANQTDYVFILEQIQNKLASISRENL